VEAARRSDAAAFEEGAQHLGSLDAERVRVLLGDVVRRLLEAQHLDGLTGDDIASVLERCVGSAAPWFPAVDPGVLVVVLTGALGVLDVEDDPQPVTPLDVARHGCLLVAELLGPAGDLAPLLEAALAEVARAETQEMP
jgi:hypothetical protein